MIDRDNLFYTVVFGALTAQLIALAVVLGYRYWQEWMRYQENQRAAKRYVKRHGPLIGEAIERDMEGVIGEAQAASAFAPVPCPPAPTIRPGVPSTPEEPCPTCAGHRDFCCTIKCPAGCGAWAAVYQFDHRARGQYRSECENGHWGDLDPRSELLPPPWRQSDPEASSGQTAQGE